MIRRALFAASLALLAAPSGAVTLALRSGEHDGFTRLVLPIPGGADWVLKRMERRAELRITGDGIVFDTAGVFDRIPRTRLEALRPGQADGTLAMVLGCDCEVRDFREAGRYLVIDIADPEPAAEPAAPALLPVNLPVYRFTSPAPPPPPSDSTAPEGAGPTLPSASGTVAPHLPDPGLADAAAERQLVEQILRASDQGLLDLRNPGPVRPAMPVTPPATEREPVPEQPGGSARNVAVATGADAATPVGADTPDLPGPTCPTVADDIGSWSAGLPLHAALTRHRAGLYTEFDRIDPGEVVALARVYLHFGFGAEAGRVLALAPADTSDLSGLAALARLVDGETGTSESPFQGQQSCDGDAAMWSVLSEPVDPDEVKRNAVLRTFARLPAHLRRHLAPILAARFADAGDPGTADALLRATARAGRGSDPSVLVAGAEVDRLRDRPGAEAAKLERVAGSGSAHAPRALVGLVEAKLRNRETVDPGLPELVAAYALEYRHSELGAGLRRAHAVSLALSGRFDAAMTALGEVSERDGRNAMAAALRPVLELLTANADDIVFLRHALPVIGPQGPGPDAGTVGPMARRLLDLGFPGPAADLLARPPAGEMPDSLRLLRAEAALAQGLPHRAMVELLGLEGREPERMRASAMAQTGDFAAFGDYMLRAGDSDAAARGFWLSGRGGEALEASPGTDGRYSRIADLSDRLAAPDANAADLPPLARARNLLADSETMRTDLRRLLDSTLSAGPAQTR